MYTFYIREHQPNNNYSLILKASLRYITKKKTLLELTLAEDFKDLKNVQVVSINLMPDDVSKIASIMRKRIESEPGSCWFVDEMVLPATGPGNQLTEELQGLVKHMKTQNMQPCLWIAIAGFKSGKAKNMEKEKIQSVLPDFYLPGLDMPLRNTLAMLTWPT